jgi:hypothetical protein
MIVTVILSDLLKHRKSSEPTILLNTSLRQVTICVFIYRMVAPKQVNISAEIGQMFERLPFLHRLSYDTPLFSKKNDLIKELISSLHSLASRTILIDLGFPHNSAIKMRSTKTLLEAESSGLDDCQVDITSTIYVTTTY